MIFFALILAFGIRLISLNQSLWIDEATSAMTTKMSLSNFFTKFMPGDFHPPLYYLTLRVWSTFFGTSETAIRSLSVLFGVATIYLVYLIGKDLLNKEIGIIASLLLATSGLHIYYSQEARMYSMSTFLVTMAIFSFVKILKEKSRRVWWFTYAITIGLIGLTDYLPLLILIPIWLFAFMKIKNVNWWKRFIMSHIILIILWLLWTPTFIKQLTSGVNITNTSPSWVNVLGKFSLKDVLLIPVKFGIGRISFDNRLIYTSIIGILLFIFGFLIYKSKKYFKDIKLIYFWLIIPIVLALAISIKLPVLNYFRFLFVLPALYLILVCGVVSLNKRIRLLFLFLVIAVNLITSFMYLTNQKFQREDWRSFAKFIGQEPVIFPADSQKEAFLYYNPKANIIDLSRVDSIKNVWLMRYAVAISDPTDSTRMKIEKFEYKKTGEYDFNGVTVWKYTK